MRGAEDYRNRRVFKEENSPVWCEIVILKTEEDMAHGGSARRWLKTESRSDAVK